MPPRRNLPPHPPHSSTNLRRHRMLLREHHGKSRRRSGVRARLKFAAVSVAAVVVGKAKAATHGAWCGYAGLFQHRIRYT